MPVIVLGDGSCDAARCLGGGTVVKVDERLVMHPLVQYGKVIPESLVQRPLHRRRLLYSLSKKLCQLFCKHLHLPEQR